MNKLCIIFQEISNTRRKFRQDFDSQNYKKNKDLKK